MAVAQISDLKIVDRSYYGVKLACFLDELKFLGVTVDVEEVYKLIPSHFRFPEDLSSVTRDSVLLLLKCMQLMGADPFVSAHNIGFQAWMKTNSGFRCPSGSLLSDPRLDHLCNVVFLPIIDDSYYGSRIRSYKAELAAIGVIVNLDSASKLIFDQLKLRISSAGLTGVEVISLLNFLKCAKNEMPSLVSCIVSCLLGEMWVKTNHGYNCASNSILFNHEWGTFPQFVDLSIIDKAFYGDEIYSFKDELMMLGAVVNFSDGIRISVRGLKLPEEPSLITADIAFSLLHCVASLKIEISSDEFLLDHLLQKLREARWLKTHMGYRFPHEALLYDLDWECYLKELDGPFIDRSFYKNLSSLEENALRLIGVKTGAEEVCNLVFQNITSVILISQIKRIYRFMQKFQWTPKLQDNVTYQLLVPANHYVDQGKWVDNNDCVIHDDSNLFDHYLHILDKFYEMKLLNFLSSAFSVAWVPTLDKYMDLWKFWLESKRRVTSVELKSFWGYILRNWDDCTLEILCRSINVLPAVDVLGEIQLVEKGDVLIADDLQLKMSFSESTKRPLFIWLPQDDFMFQGRLCEIYSSLGVKKLSESVEYLVNSNFKLMDPEDYLIGKPLD